MKNKLSDLNNHLFESLERLNDDSLDEEGLNREIKRAEAVSRVAETIIHNGELALKAAKYAQEIGIDRNQELPPMLEA